MTDLNLPDLRAKAERVESAVDSIRNPLARHSIEQENLVIEVAEAVVALLDRLERAEAHIERAVLTLRERFEQREFVGTTSQAVVFDAIWVLQGEPDGADA